MNERLHEHPFIVIVTICVLIGSATSGIIKWFYDERINSIITKYEAEIAVLKKNQGNTIVRPTEAGEGVNSNSGKLKNIHSNPFQSTDNTSKQQKLEKPQYRGEVFEKGNPFPKGFEIKPGIRISVLRALNFPSGELDPSLFKVDLPTGPFNGIYFHHEGVGNDPKVESISFPLRDTEAAAYIRAQGLVAFGSDRMVSEIQGKVLRWKNIGGFQVRIDDSFYRIEKRD